MERTWTTVGAAKVELVGGTERVEQEIAGLDWQATPGYDGHLTVAFSPGLAIKKTIAELRIPRVSAIAIGSIDCPPATGDEDGYYPGFYGIEGNYQNGRARVYVLDDGLVLTPLASDFEPVERGSHAEV